MRIAKATNRLSELEELILRYRANCLPEEVKLIYIPMKKTAYGDYEIATTYVVPKDKELTVDHGMTSEEHIRIKRYRFGDQEVFAGYGEETKTLVIGKKMESLR